MFAQLTDELLGRVVFSSGYLSHYWKDVFQVLLVSKRFLTLGRAHLRSVCVKSCLITPAWLCQTLPSFASNLTSLSLDFTLRAAEQFPSGSAELSRLCTTLAPSLTRLGLRGTAVGDDALVSLAPLLHRLRALDLSKSSRSFAPLITDAGLRALLPQPQPQQAAASRLVWLNLSMTQVTDAGVLALVPRAPHLRHLGLQCCQML